MAIPLQVQEPDIEQEFLIFALGAEAYALDILDVQEIRSFDRPTQIANAPPFIKGIINLRGTIVPIIDLRIKFATGTADYTPFTVVIILHVGGRPVGIVVDAVSDVTRLRAEQIRPAPAFGAGVDASYIRGVAATEARTLIVVDTAQLLRATDLPPLDTLEG